MKLNTLEKAAVKGFIKNRVKNTAGRLSPSKIKKRIVAGTVAAATAVSLLTASATNPADLLQDDKSVADVPAAIVETYVPDTPPDDGGEDGAADEQEDKKRLSLRQKIRALLLRLPLSVRALVCVPMWCIGWGISSGAGALGSALAGSIGGSVLRVIFSALAVFTLIVLSVKTLAPDVPVKKLLSKKTATIALLAAILAEIAFVLLELFLPDGGKIAELVKSLAALVLMLVAAVPFTVKTFKKQTKS